MKTAIVFLAFFILAICCDYLSATRGRPGSAGGHRQRQSNAIEEGAIRTKSGVFVQSRSHSNNLRYANKFFKKYFKSQFNARGVKGRCKMSPAWQINGTYPVLQAAKRGYATILFLMKTPCRSCWHDVQALNDWAKWYKAVGIKAKVIVLAHKNYGVIPFQARRSYRYVHFYNEPKDQNIFKLLKARYHDILMYDKCGRHVYHYGQPWSSLWKPFVKAAMTNTINHWKTFCGVCKPVEIPTPAPLLAPSEPEESAPVIAPSEPEFSPEDAQGEPGRRLVMNPDEPPQE